MDTPLANSVPRFHFDVDGKRYGARLLTIREQATCQAEIDRLTDGNFEKWMISQEINQKVIAFATQAAVLLNAVIIQWPEGEEQQDFTKFEDMDLVTVYWEAYAESAKSFRGSKSGSVGKSGDLDKEVPTSSVVSGSVQGPADGSSVLGPDG